MIIRSPRFRSPASPHAISLLGVHQLCALWISLSHFMPNFLNNDTISQRKVGTAQSHAPRPIDLRQNRFATQPANSRSSFRQFIDTRRLLSWVKPFAFRKTIRPEDKPSCQCKHVASWCLCYLCPQCNSIVPFSGSITGDRISYLMWPQGEWR